MGAHPILRVQISEFDGFLLIEMPFFGEVPLFHINVSVTKYPLGQTAKDIVCLNDFDLDDSGSWKLNGQLVTQIILRIVLFEWVPRILEGFGLI